MKILHADEHTLFREGLQFFLRQLDNEVTIIEANNLQATLELIAQHRNFDLVLLDMDMPGMVPGFFTIHQIYPDVSIVGLSAIEEPETIRMLIHHGAKGYLLKSYRSEVLLNALRQILEGGIHVPPIYYLEIANQRFVNHLYILTKCQQNILQLIRKGLSNRQIANQLNVTESTVKNHLKTIVKILGVYDCTQFVPSCHLSDKPFQNDKDCIL